MASGKTVAKTPLTKSKDKKGQSMNKPSELSAEFVIDSDSETSAAEEAPRSPTAVPKPASRNLQQPASTPSPAKKGSKESKEKLPTQNGARHDSSSSSPLRAKQASKPSTAEKRAELLNLPGKTKPHVNGSQKSSSEIKLKQQRAGKAPSPVVDSTGGESTDEEKDTSESEPEIQKKLPSSQDRAKSNSALRHNGEKTSNAHSRNAQNTSHEGVAELQEKTYTPPNGFSATKVSMPPSSVLPSLFSPEELSTKQIWHITTPALIPVTAVQRASMQSINEGSSITTYRGSEYGFCKDSHVNRSRLPVLLPSQSGKRFHFLQKPIDRTLHLQQLIRLPKLGPERSRSRATDRAGATSDANGPQQPHGLKMRYRPFGDAEPQPEGSGNEGNEGPVENETLPPKFHAPTMSDHSKRGEKRKATKAEDDHSTSQELRTKKRKKDSSRIAKATQQTPEANTEDKLHCSSQPVTQESLNANGIRSLESQMPQAKDVLPSPPPAAGKARREGHKKRKKDKHKVASDE